MCVSFIEIKNGKIIGIKGIYKKGHWVYCRECGILQIKKSNTTTKRQKKNNE